jgi:integrase
MKWKAKVVEDRTGAVSYIPILVDEEGPLKIVLDFILYLEETGRSLSTMHNAVHSIELFIEYLVVNGDLFTDLPTLFRTFAKRMYTGTVGEDGLDPSGLYWLPSSARTVAKKINILSQYFDFISSKYGLPEVNPSVKASPVDAVLAYAAWYRKNQNDFLGHIEDKTVSLIGRDVQIVRGRRVRARNESAAQGFPEEEFWHFFDNGLGRKADPRAVLRDQLIVLLMHGGGLRVSEALSLWTCDVIPEEIEGLEGLLYARVYHPEEGKAPYGYRAKNGSTTRAAYLKEKYGLTPRNRLYSFQRVGWKSGVVDDPDNFIRMYWLPCADILTADGEPDFIFAQMFTELWKKYMLYRSDLKDLHPYAFVSWSRDNKGEPYTQTAFVRNYKEALRRAGLPPGRANVHNPHSHRHAYGRRCVQLRMPPAVIKKFLHHSSLESQAPYTVPRPEDAYKIIEENIHRMNWKGACTSDISIPPKQNTRK